ncbi:MAG: 50S ribosomal protein L3 N(5)-glutamine methyltransferase, partial [Gammaproteobacteria bacterium]|nr:50S ribosomal protein L3 N(5)-glutamine methyltransferase [Gammaproteobacteria bacterium]
MTLKIPEQVQTLSELVEWCADELDIAPLYFGHGTDNALDEAAWLVAFALNLNRDYAGVDISRAIDEKEKKAILSLLERRITEHLPTAYLTNEAWFAGYCFYVDENVLIPRSPIAELINNRFKPWLAGRKISHILDIGTGSGCIAIACAMAFPEARVDAT